MSITKRCPWTGAEVEVRPHPTKPGRVVAISPNGRAFWESDAAPIKKTRTRIAPIAPTITEEVTNYDNAIDD